MSSDDESWIAERVAELTDRRLSCPPKVFTDTSCFMSIDRDHVVALDDRFFLVRGNEHEGRFGLDDQPKFWVKRAIALDSGAKVILKLVFHEDFLSHIGTLKVRCRRSEEKEARVLELARGDLRFMQGSSARDARGNLVRIIDFIPGENLLAHLRGIKLSHDEYFHTEFVDLIGRVLVSLKAIQCLHDAGTCHGDIRNDHIIIERGTGRFRWIDFDLTQNFPDFDLWSVGNILQAVVGKGLATFHDTLRRRPQLSGVLTGEDASILFPHRFMNLRKVYPYVPAKLNDILLHFSVGSEVFYDSVTQITEDLGDAMAAKAYAGRQDAAQVLCEAE